MNMIASLILVSGLIFLTQLSGQQKGALPKVTDMVLIPAGTYTPFFKASNNAKVKIEAFYVDQYPVTNEQFLEFVSKNPKWRKSKVKEIFADSNYLRNWKSDLELGKQVLAKSPVTYVSWFAAKAYAAWIGKRLLTVEEWEYIGRASSTKTDGVKDAAYKKVILEWYSKPGISELPSVGKSIPNIYHVYDLHGMIWEWVLNS